MAILLGPKYSSWVRDSNINQQRNLSRPQGRNINICGGMFRIQNFPYTSLGPHGASECFVSGRRTWHSPNLIHRLHHCTEDPTPIHPHNIFYQMDASWYYSSTSTSVLDFRWLRHILRDFIFSGTSLRLQTIGTFLHEVPPYVMF
jgi:hypothetical protein